MYKGGVRCKLECDVLGVLFFKIEKVNNGNATIVDGCIVMEE